MSLYGNLYDYDDLSARAKTVYMYLKDRSNKEGQCWPSVKTIAHDTSLSKSTIKRAIADLISYGLLRKEERLRANGGLSSNLYFLS